MFKGKKLKRVVIKEELVNLTGKVNQAIVLNQMIYWSERVKDSDKFIKEELDRVRKFADGSEESLENIKKTLESGWIYKTSDEMISDCMLTISRQTMNRIFDNLVENSWISKRRNPKYKWDKTWQYRVNLNEIQKDLLKLGFNLEGYTLPQCEDEPSNVQNEPAIPEITTEITTELEEEDKRRRIVNNNEFLKSLKKYLIETTLTPKTINNILKECITNNLLDSTMDKVDKQYKFMIREHDNGKEIHNFAKFFVGGLLNKTEQLHISQEQKNIDAKNPERDTSFYYNWLAE